MQPQNDDVRIEVMDAVQEPPTTQIVGYLIKGALLAMLLWGAANITDARDANTRQDAEIKAVNATVDKLIEIQMSVTTMRETLARIDERTKRLEQEHAKTSQ